MRSGTRPAVTPAPTAGVHQVSIGAVMPDLTGTPKKLLLPLLLRQDLSVSISGSGFVTKQDPPPGTKIESGMKITLELQ